MKLFRCDHCGNVLYFENTVCENCGHALGYWHAANMLVSLEPEAEHLFGPNGMDLSLRPAAARAGHDQGRALAEQLAGFWREF